MFFRSKNSFSILTFFLFTIVISFSTPSYANPKYASLVIDADTGVVLHQENAGKTRHPASLVKMMTLYMTFQAIERGELSMNQNLKVSARAAGMPASKLGLRRGSTITVKDAILALIVKSANDAAVVLAEGIGGSEWKFATMMNRMGKKLGMNETNFVNASGLHNSRQVTTAYDMARLAVALRRDYPRHYHLFNRTKFYFNGKVYQGHNKVASSYQGADGLKTGYINAAGFNLVTSVRRGGNSVVGVVLGGTTSKRRDRHMVQLLDRVFYKMAKGGNAPKATMHTGVVPFPNLKPGRSMQAAVSDSTPEPNLKPQV
ncbi:MAG: hypothetical protein COV35_10145 [Alphaproteobacteria bacterium CG11_big_fil_rev_8_21_14_0_20_39_49]|nr:MAG: hypothetical protein COV35_10145 [Alphaproteobacteria bacterium CG11_big_fil_rev_8_21_14_0_20_39_49]